jgi:hypothetical protein
MCSQYEGVRWNRYDKFKTHKIPRRKCPNVIETNYPEWRLPISPTRAQFLAFWDSVRVYLPIIPFGARQPRDVHPTRSAAVHQSAFPMITCLYYQPLHTGSSSVRQGCPKVCNKPSLNKQFVRSPFRNVSRILRQTLQAKMLQNRYRQFIARYLDIHGS